MTSIGKIVRETPAAARAPQPSTPVDASEAMPTGRALVSVAPLPPPAEDGRKSSRRGSASFIAQLIANEIQLPQARERRRAEPHVALTAYRAAAGLMRR